ncbi:hypothetical protein CEXT_333711 [Caerostris extrusa]|uniref:Uncharacterized protein n=1 Tax=Caerostris extrusa TaxID=172846 RepID=A0AAV4XWP3_CAEEX|nr:hypothetical protein CEXT_333711 [Caerostris extrusa]
MWAEKGGGEGPFQWMPQALFPWARQFRRRDAPGLLQKEGGLLLEVVWIKDGNALLSVQASPPRRSVCPTLCTHIDRIIAILPAIKYTESFDWVKGYPSARPQQHKCPSCRVQQNTYVTSLSQFVSIRDSQKPRRTPPNTPNYVGIKRGGPLTGYRRTVSWGMAIPWQFPCAQIASVAGRIVGERDLDQKWVMPFLLRTPLLHDGRLSLLLFLQIFRIPKVATAH